VITDTYVSRAYMSYVQIVTHTKGSLLPAGNVMRIILLQLSTALEHHADYRRSVENTAKDLLD
jgi:hypothetical protein